MGDDQEVNSARTDIKKIAGTSDIPRDSRASKDELEPVETGPSWMKDLSATYLGGRPVGDIPFYIEHWFYSEPISPYDSDEPLFVSEPYQMSGDDVRELARFCETRGLEFRISGWSRHNEDCFRVVIWKPKHSFIIADGV